MMNQTASLNKENWKRCAHGIRKFRTSEVGADATRLFVLLVLFMLLVNGLNVIASYVGRDFMTAIENRRMSAFLWWTMVYVGILAVSTLVIVVYRYCEERLGLLWREWLTRRMVVRYLEHPTYYRLGDPHLKDIETKNPDQRIADDVRQFTTTTLSFALILINATLTILAFSGVLWSISPLLFVVAVLYAIAGSFLTFRFGKPLIGLNYDQLDKEANFRSALIHVRENAEAVALNHDETLLKSRVLRRLSELVDNTQRIIEVNRRLGFFTTGYNNLILIIPAALIAPLFIEGKVEFGVITQAAMAFSSLLGAFSLVVNQFQAISWFAAVIVRLGTMMEAMDQALAADGTGIRFEVTDDAIKYHHLTLRSPSDGRTLLDDFSIALDRGQRLLIRSEDNTAKIALFRATAGIWDCGEGSIGLPGDHQIIFLPEYPYVPPGTLRELFTRREHRPALSAERIATVAHALQLDRVIERIGGLDVEGDWNDLLSVGELKLIAVARACLAGPRFIFLDRLGTALNAAQVQRALSVLTEQGITYLAIGDGADKAAAFDTVMDIAADGRWEARAYKAG